MPNNICSTYFGGEERAFAFNLNEIEELQRLTGCGLGTLVDRVLNHQFYFGDLYHTIRLGLIGAEEMSSLRAKELVDLNLIGKPLARPDDPSSPLAVASVILGSIMYGVAVKEDAPPKPEAGMTTEASSTFPPSEPPPSKPEATL